jgi:hypothetical protein
MTDDVLEEVGVELEPVQATPAAAMTLWGTSDPAEVVRKATEAATVLADVVRRKPAKGQEPMVLDIAGREFVRVEGWGLLGSMIGIFAVVEWTREVDNGWEARVVARTRDGAVVGAGESECLRSERLWAMRDDFALRAMAQTRATSRALRQPLGFVMKLAGFEPLAAEEMDAGETKPQLPSFAKPKDADKKKLQKLVERLIEGEHITPEQFEAAAKTITPWPGCLDELDAAVVSDLLTRLETYERNVAE